MGFSGVVPVTGMNPAEPNSAGRFDSVWILGWLLAAAWVIPIVPLLSVIYYRPVIGTVLLLFAVALLVRFSSTAALALRAVDPWIWALLAYTVISISWSPAPTVSAKRTIQEVGIPLVGIALLVPGYASSWLTSHLRFMATVLLLVSITVCIVLPGYGIDPGWGGGPRWVGITDHKNQLGRLCLLCVVLWAFSTRTDTSPVTWRIVIIVLSIVTLLFTDNATSLVALLGVLLLFALVRTAKLGWTPLWFVAFGAGLTLGHILLVSLGYPTPLEFMEGATGLVGRDTELKGRADLWAYMWTEIEKHPWFGTGYAGSWLAAYEDSGGVTYQSNWDPTQSHSSYVDILMETGIVGLTLWAMVIFSHGRRLLALRRIEPDIAHLHTALLFCVLLCSCFSTLFYRGLSGPWNIILWVSLIEVCYLSFIYRKQYPRLYYAQPASA